MAAAPNSVDTGTFNDGELRPWTEAKAGVGSAKTVNFSPAYVAAPSLAWGLSTIDLPYQGNLGLTAHLENITASSMKVHLDPIQNSTVYNSAVNWFETKDRDFQTGSQELVWSISGQVPQPRVNPVFIRFNRPYHKPPRVVVWLAGFQISKDFNARLYCYPSQITEFGFYLNAATWGDTVVNLSYHTWIAYPIDKVGVTSAICNTSDVRDGGQIEIKEVSENVKFPAGTFDPKHGPVTVILGANAFDMGNWQNFRFDTGASNVTNVGFTWTGKTWANSTMYSAGAAWIAFQKAIMN